MKRHYSHTKCYVSVAALRHNAAALKSRLGSNSQLGLVVKSEAYGHGLALAVMATADLTRLFLVQTVDEALRVRGLVPDHRIIVVGPTPAAAFDEVLGHGLEITISSMENLEELGKATARFEKSVEIHAKLETGTHRQGFDADELPRLLDSLGRSPRISLRGVSTHFADIEDTLDHGFAMEQFSRFRSIADRIEAELGQEVEFHCANSAATLLWPKTHGTFVRCGIASYGLWPSRETWLSTIEDDHPDLLELKPALSWRAEITQIKQVKSGSFISYGRTYRTTSPARIAVLGVGYADGYDRRLSNQAHAILAGIRVPVRGRVCMNLTMVDVTDVKGCFPGDEVTLLGSDGQERVSAEQLASWIGTINYEVPTRIAADVPRIAVDIPDEMVEKLVGKGISVETSP